MRYLKKSALFVILLTLTTALHSEAIFIDWQLRLPQQTLVPDNETNTTNDSWPDFIPLPFPSDYSSTHPYTKDLMNSRANAGKPCAVMLTNRSAPINGEAELRPSLDQLIGYVKRLDYCFADIEGPLTDTQAQVDLNQIISKVHASSNGNIKNAWIGNYGYAPGAPRMARIYADQNDNTDRSQYYLSSGLNVAQPPCYPLSASIAHTWSASWGANICPNKISAMFWRPLEEFSGAARNTPKNHKLLPWVTVYDYVSGYTSPIPTREDSKALIKHYRMRRADGIARLAISTDLTGVPTDSWLRSYTGNQHRQDILDCWKSLDAYFGTYVTSYMNLNTTKTTGLEWSGVRYRNTVKVLVSNLSSKYQSASYPSDWGNLPATSAAVAPNTHKEFTYTISSLEKNFDFSTTLDPWITDGTGGRISTGGVNNGPCMKFAGSSWGAYYGKGLMATDAGAQMYLNLALSSNNSGARFFAQAYCLDKDKNYISGVFCPIAPHSTITTTTTSYTFNFNVPSDNRIKYIQPIFYNARYDSSPSDELYVDNVTINFQ